MERRVFLAEEKSRSISQTSEERLVISVTMGNNVTSHDIPGRGKLRGYNKSYKKLVRLNNMLKES